MTNTTIASFESTIHKTNVWLKDVMQELDWDSHERAYHALRTVLHTLRVISKHVSSGEIDDIKHTLPRDIRELWT